jgi:alpha-1,2-mannosyltransferase
MSTAPGARPARIGSVRTVVTALLVVAVAVVIGASTATLTLFGRQDAALLAGAIGAAWVLFALALVALRRVPDRAVAVLVIGGSLLIGGAGLAGPPNTSTDSARYAWDGLVATSGVSPYDFVPLADELADLRPDWLFPEPVVAPDGAATCPQVRVAPTTTVPSGEPACTALNRPHVPTIYPPVAELYFAAVALVSTPEAQYLPLQIGGLMISVGVTVLLLVSLRRRGMDPRWAAIWAWCPLVATEAVTNSHVDVLGAGLALLASLLISSGRRVGGGIALGAAIATKLIPIIVAPPLLRRRWWTVALAAVGTFAAVYVPYVLASGPEVLGYLPGYLSEEGYDDGSRFALLSAVLPGPVAIVVAAVLLAAAAGLAIAKADPSRPWMTQVVLIGVVLIAVSPRYPWYALLLVPFVAMSGRVEWLVVAVALSARQFFPMVGVLRVALLIAVVVVIAAWLLRRRAKGRPARLEPADDRATG